MTKVLYIEDLVTLLNIIMFNHHDV